MADNREEPRWRTVEAGRRFLGFTADGSRMITADAPRTVWVTDFATGRAVSRHEIGGWSIDYVPVADLVATSASNGRTAVLHFPSGRSVTWKSHDDSSTHVAFSPDGKWLVTRGAKDDPRIFFWSVNAVWEALFGRGP
jgi:WD40 repeat protein